MDRSTQSGRRDEASSSRHQESDGCAEEGWQPPLEGSALTWDQVQPGRSATRERISKLVHAIESEVIPRLVRAHRHSTSETIDTPQHGAVEAEQVRSFAHLVIATDDSAAFARIDALCRDGLRTDAIYLNLLAPTARFLGTMWEDDLCDFATLTVGVGRLQQIMRALSPAFGAEVSPPAHGRRILLAPAPGEQHTFGLSMVTEFFMRAGWDVASTTGMHADNLTEWLQSEWFDVLGFSKGSSLRVDDLASAVAQARRQSRNGAMVVMVGGPLFTLHPEFVAQVGADGTARDAEAAPLEAEKLLGQSIHKT